MRERRVLLAAGAIAIVVAAVVSFRELRQQGPAASASPTPTAAEQDTGSPTSSPTATTEPSPTPVGRYVSAAMGYSIELPPPWHRASCGSSTSGPLENREGVELLVPIPDRELELGDVGGAHSDNIQVFARANPNGLSPVEWERSGQFGGDITRVTDEVTFAGRPGLLVRARHLDGTVSSEIETFLVANGGFMYEVGHTAVTQVTTAAQRGAIVRSFRFISAEEASAARASPTPSPAPRSPEQVADELAEGFAARDITILATVITQRCFGEGVANGGASSRTGEAYLEKLHDAFARGLTVEVAPRPISGEQGRTLTIRSTWREPGQPDREVDLMIVVEGNTAYRVGTIG